jgi:hypothetical protein
LHNDVNEDKPAVSLKEYARKRRMNDSHLYKKLKEAGVIFSDRNILYLHNPVQFKHMVRYDTQRLKNGGYLQILKWNENGVGFLDEFVKLNYKKQPKTKFSF